MGGNVSIICKHEMLTLKIMTIKKYVKLSLLLTLFFGVIIIGCGGDDEDEEKPEVDETAVIGSWEIESINGRTFRQAFSRDVEAQAGIEEKLELIANDWEFNDDGTWSWYFEFKTESNFSEPVYSIMSHQDYSVNGTYTVDGANMTVTEGDVKLNTEITLEPADFLESQGSNAEILEAQAEQELEAASSEIVLDGEIDCSWGVQDDILTLTHPEGVLVLKRK